MRLKTFFEKQGCPVISLTRSTPVPGETMVPFRLNSGVAREQLQNVDALIHCAYDFSALRWKDILKKNVEGSKRLFQDAKAAGVSRIVLISTMSAFPGCRSLYGRAKLLIEDEAKRTGAFIIRPGLVYDAQAGGMVGALCNAVKKLPLIPIMGNGDQMLHLLHSEDFCHFVFQVASGHIPLPAHPVTLANEQGFTFRDILKIIAKGQGKMPAFVPIPGGFLYAILRTAEVLGFRGRLRGDALLGLIHYDPSPSFTEMRRLGFAPRLFSEKTLREDLV
jgi:nucleoside-diphosphate-sugar epimerase